MILTTDIGSAADIAVLPCYIGGDADVMIRVCLYSTCRFWNIRGLRRCSDFPSEYMGMFYIRPVDLGVSVSCEYLC